VDDSDGDAKLCEDAFSSRRRFAALWSYSARWQSQRRLKEAAVPLAGYFHPSRYALDVFRQVGDKKDFEEQMRGLMAPMQDLKIMGDVGPGAWS